MSVVAEQRIDAYVRTSMRIMLGYSAETRRAIILTEKRALSKRNSADRYQRFLAERARRLIAALERTL